MTSKKMRIQNWLIAQYVWMLLQR